MVFRGARRCMVVHSGALEGCTVVFGGVHRGVHSGAQIFMELHRDARGGHCGASRFTEEHEAGHTGSMRSI